MKRYQRVIRLLAGVILAGMFSLAARAQPDEQNNLVIEEENNLVIENVPEIPAAISERVVAYRDAGSSAFLDWAPNSKSLLINTRFHETKQLYIVERASGKRQQITFLPEPVERGRFRPGTTDVVFASDVGGTEDYHLFYFDGTTGETRHLTPNGGRNTRAVFSDDGNTLVWSRSAPGAPDRNIMLATAPNFDNARVLFAAPGSWSVTDFSPDGSSLVLRHFVSDTTATLHILNIATGEVTDVMPSQDLHSFSAAEFSSDGLLLYFLADADDENNNLYQYAVRSGETHNLTRGINKDIDNFDLSPDGKFLAFTVNENGASRFEIMRTSGGRKLRAPRIPVGLVESFAFSPNGRKIAYTFSASQSPGNVFTFRPGRRDVIEWTRSETVGLQVETFVEPRQITYPTFDRVDGAPRQIPAYLYLPAGEGPHPVVVYIHGGPAFQFRPRFYAIFQYWLNEMGIAVIAPNVRGSSGYGKAYRQLDDQLKREDSVRDIGALIDWIETQQEFDRERIALYGGSYGGYMVLSSLMHYNDRLAGGVSSSGISNFVTFLENTRPYRQDLRRAEYGDERDPVTRAFLQDIAPANHAEKITKPLFLIHGRNDPRVPWTEAVQMLEEIKTAGGRPWFLMAEDEGHGFRKKANSDYRDAAIAVFYQQLFLREEGA